MSASMAWMPLRARFNSACSPMVRSHRTCSTGSGSSTSIWARLLHTCSRTSGGTASSNCAQPTTSRCRPRRQTKSCTLRMTRPARSACSPMRCRASRNMPGAAAGISPMVAGRAEACRRSRCWREGSSTRRCWVTSSTALPRNSSAEKPTIAQKAEVTQVRQPARSRAPERGQGILHGLAKGQRFGQGGRGRQRHAQIHHFGARAVIERHTAGESEGRRRGSTRGQAGQGTGGPSTSMSSGTDEFCRPRLVDHRRWQDPRTLKPHRSSARRKPGPRQTREPGAQGAVERLGRTWPGPLQSFHVLLHEPTPPVRPDARDCPACRPGPHHRRHRPVRSAPQRFGLGARDLGLGLGHRHGAAIHQRDEVLFPFHAAGGGRQDLEHAENHCPCGTSPTGRRRGCWRRRLLACARTRARVHRAGHHCRWGGATGSSPLLKGTTTAALQLMPTAGRASSDASGAMRLIVAFN